MSNNSLQRRVFGSCQFLFVQTADQFWNCFFTVVMIMLEDIISEWWLVFSVEYTKWYYKKIWGVLAVWWRILIKAHEFYLFTEKWFFSGLWWNCRHFGNNSEVGKIGAFYLEITFWMQATGSGLRFLSSFLWIQMYRLGVASDTVAAYQPIDFDGRIGGFSLFHSNSPTPVAKSRQTSMSDEVLGGSIYNPAAYASLLERLDNDTYLDIEVRNFFMLPFSDLGTTVSCRWCKFFSHILSQSSELYSWHKLFISCDWQPPSSGGVSKDILYTPPRCSSLVWPLLKARL